jgi:hypothetical protein
MDIINSCFRDITFTKVEAKERFAIYAAAVTSSYGDGRKQYILAFVPEHLAIQDVAYIFDLRWENIQTRTLKNGYKIQPQRWTLPRDIPNFMFELVERTQDKSKYRSGGHPLELVLLHDPKKTSSYQYHNRMNLLACLITFRCVISIIDSALGSNFDTTFVDNGKIDPSFELIK